MIDAKTLKKFKGRSVSWLIKKTQEEFNRYIRNRDAEGDYFTCISCGVTKGRDQMNAGHFLSTGHHSEQRFNEDNCHGQCIRCNQHLHGNLLEYRNGIIRKIGLEATEMLSIRSKGFKWDRISLIDKLTHYRALNKEG